MEYYHNPGKALEIEVAGERYLRHGIRTHFVEVGEDYLDLFRRYVVPVYRPGDWVAVSEKVAALCQGRVIHRQEIQSDLAGPPAGQVCPSDACRPGHGTAG